jgi:hypothetical protein
MALTSRHRAILRWFAEPKCLKIAVAFSALFGILLGLSGNAGKGKRPQIPALV